MKIDYRQPIPVPTDGSQQRAVRVKGVTKSFSDGQASTVVLHGTDFDANRGEMMLLVGPSGCGKTTLLSIIAGTLNADAGEIEVMGQRIDQMTTAAVTRFRAVNLGFVFQQFNLISTVSVVENVAVPLLIAGLSASRAEARAREILARVGLGDRANSRPGRLSGGQQQRVAIARALVHDPPLILCDEPTSALDRENGRQVMEILHSISRDPGRCVIIVTHDPRTYRYADRMAEMEDGEIRRVLHSSKEIADVYEATAAH